jgi:KDO2-lipid IV(A) lauroyltransferase
MDLKGNRVLRRAVVIGLTVIAALPFRLCHGIGYCLGNLLYWLPNDARRITRINLRLCFPDLDTAARARLARRSLIQLAQGVFELGALWLWPGDRLLSLVREVEGLEQLREALTEGRGVIMLTPHLGAFELTGLYCGHYFKGTSLYRPTRIGLDAELCRWRGRLGHRLVPTDRRGVSALRRALERGEGVGILPDQDPPRGGGVYAPFFDIETYTISLPSRLAIRTGAVVMVIVAERLPLGRGFRLRCRRAADTIREEPLEASVAAMNHEIETLIRELPEQYVWSYKRFKTRPPGVARRY